ncbi:MAG: quinolinate synthase NadA [Acidimicrobiales bacterium]
MVNRLAAETPDKTVVSLDPLVCPCSTMFRIGTPHLAWILENLVEGRILNRITVDERTTEWAKVALQRMLDITQGNPVQAVRDPATDTRPLPV